MEINAETICKTDKGRKNETKIILVIVRSIAPVIKKLGPWDWGIGARYGHTLL